MAIRDIFKISRRTFFNPSAWIDVDALKTYNKTIGNILSGLFAPVKPMREETFDEAVQRLGLTELDVQNTAKNYRNFAYIFFILGVLVVIFGCYLLFHYATGHGFLLSIAAAALLLVQGYKYHFWYFQIKHRKLGCTYKEWWRGKPDDKGPFNKDTTA